MVRCRGDHSRPLESAACSRDTVRSSARKRGPEGTEFAPIRRLRNGTALRTSGEDHVERAAQNRVSLRTVSPRARPPAPLLHHPCPSSQSCPAVQSTTSQDSRQSRSAITWLPCLTCFGSGSEPCFAGFGRAAV